VDEAMAVMSPWDFDPSEVACTLTWWQGEHDANALITAVQRLVAGMVGSGPATVEGGRASGVVPPARRDTCGDSRSLIRLEPRQSVAHRDHVDGVRLLLDVVYLGAAFAFARIMFGTFRVEDWSRVTGEAASGP